MFILPLYYTPRKSSGSQNYVREAEFFHRNNGIINPELNSKLRVTYPNFLSNDYKHHIK